MCLPQRGEGKIIVPFVLYFPYVVTYVTKFQALINVSN